MILQQRIYELDLYDQLSPAEEGYVDPSTLFFAVDKVGWAKPKKILMSNFLFADHIEAGSATITSVNVSVTYDTSFGTLNYVLMIYAYKEEDMGGNIVRSSVPYHSLVETKDGFSLTLEEFSGVVIKYFAYE